MFSPDDTIVAVATPQGRGGIGVVRISGPGALRAGAALSRRDTPLAPRHATFATIAAGGLHDQAVLTYFPAPHSYTGEDVVEVSAHGSPVLLRAIVAEAMQAGCRLAEPGEFTFRAYLHGRIDLVQAEAVRDLVEAVTPRQARAAFDQLEGTLTTRIAGIDGALLELTARLEASLDFPEEGYHFLEPDETAARLDAIAASLDDLLASARRGRLIREGLQVALVGRPNAGKSSLFNQLAGAGRAIVTPTPGTTRDLLTELIDLEGIPVTLVDTAGVHGGATDAAEIEGIARAAAVRDVAAVLVVVLDGSEPLTADDRDLLAAASGRPRVLVANKTDRPPAWDRAAVTPEPLAVSALTGEGIDALRAAIVAAADADAPARDEAALTNARHAALAASAREAVARAAAAARGGMPEELVLVDVHEARRALEEVTGERTPEDVLRAIFDTFCIGK